MLRRRRLGIGFHQTSRSI